MMLSSLFVARVPFANATVGGKPAVVALWNEGKKSNVVIDNTILGSTTFKMDINATDPGNIDGFDITITYDSTRLTATAADFNSPGCTKASGCVFDGVLMAVLAKSVNVPAGTVRLAITDVDSGIPFVNGNGILFRVTFTVSGTAGVSQIKISPSSQVLFGASPIAYQGIDGWIDDQTTPTLNYSVTPATNSVTVNRPVSGTAPGTVNVAVSKIAGSAVNPSASLRVLSLPVGVSVGFAPTSGTMPFASTLTITVTGGPASGSSTAPSGTFALVLTGNSTVTGGFIVAVGWLTLVIVPPPPPVYTLTPGSTSLTVLAGSFVLVTITGTLTSGTAEAVSLSCNLAAKLVQGDCSFAPNPATPSFSVTMNVTTGDSSTPGTVKFNVTGVSQGTYSERPVTQKIINIQLTVQPRDVGVSTIISSRVIAYAGQASNHVNVTAVNPGFGTETFWVVLYGNSSIVLGNQTLTLGPGTSRVLTFYWNPPVRGLYQLSARVQTFPWDSNFSNNSIQGGMVTAKLRGDVNGDCVVDIVDLASVGSTFGKTTGTPGFNINADLTDGGVIGIVALVIVGQSFGSRC